MQSISQPVERIRTVAHRITSEQNPPADLRMQVTYVCRRCGGTHTRYVETPAEARDVHAYPVCLECQHIYGLEPEGSC
jgi:hypothetical protein